MFTQRVKIFHAKVAKTIRKDRKNFCVLCVSFLCDFCVKPDFHRQTTKIFFREISHVRMNMQLPPVAKTNTLVWK